jgi:sulfatase modifying factor 1
MSRSRSSLILVFGGCALVAASCHDFSEIKAGMDKSDASSPDSSQDSSSQDAACNGLVIALMDGTSSCAQVPPSCQDLPATCGPKSNDSCCQYSPEIGDSSDSETFSRGYDRSLPGGATQTEGSNTPVAIVGAQALDSAPAHLHPYFLERYEVTIGRFRWFYQNYSSVNSDWARMGAGAYPAPDTANGWDQVDWNGNPNLYAQTAADLVTDMTAFGCGDAATALMMPSSSSDNEPISCVTWYEAFLFCYADGGHLPSEAQWNFAAAGGTEGRPYPWTLLTDTDLLDIPSGNANVSVDPANLGTVQPVGMSSAPGKWGHYDLAGNVWEHVLDACVDPPNDYTNMGMTVIDPMTPLDLTNDSGVVRGGSFQYTAPYARTAFRKPFSRLSSALRALDTGFRCAREPQTP